MENDAVPMEGHNPLSMDDSPPTTLLALPSEVLHQVLTYLPVSSLLTFARTSSRSYLAAGTALTTLHLAVLPRKIHSTLAFLNSTNCEDATPDSAFDGPCLHQVCVPCHLPIAFSKRSKARKSLQPVLSPAQHREALIQLQNETATSVLTTPSARNLQCLTLHLYDMTSPTLATTIATRLPQLRYLHLNLCHPYVHDTCLPAGFWTNPAFLHGSPIWNSLAGIGDENDVRLRVRGLESLHIDRAGTTSMQLRRWIEKNERLRDLTLKNVAGVDLDFVWFLGEHFCDATGRRLKGLVLENCPNLLLKKQEDFEWLGGVASAEEGRYSRGRPEPVKELSLQGCKGIDHPALMEFLSQADLSVDSFILPDRRVLIRRDELAWSGERRPGTRSASSASPVLSACGSREELKQLGAFYELNVQEVGAMWRCGQGIIEPDT